MTHSILKLQKHSLISSNMTYHYFIKISSLLGELFIYALTTYTEIDQSTYKFFFRIYILARILLPLIIYTHPPI
jgi:hypothetical protein